MARPPKLRQHKGYWYTQAGNPAGVYFGRIKDVPYNDAQNLFRKHLATLADQAAPRVMTSGKTVAEVCDQHLKWVRSERSAALLKQRKSILNFWCNHIVNTWNDEQLIGHGKKIGLLRADAITRRHVEQFLHHRCTTPSKRTKKPLGDKARRAIVIALKKTWNWAADSVEDGGGALFPATHRPLAKLSRGFIQPKDLTEADLPTDTEIEILQRWAKVDPTKIKAGRGKWRSRVGNERFTPESQVFADMLSCYHAAGARTSELCLAQVRDFMPRTRQVCLGKHKRSRTQFNPTVRSIQIDEELCSVLERNALGKRPDDALFAHASGRVWDHNEVDERFREIRRLATREGETVREHITPYSFRHLYISELLMLGVPTFKVAKLAGTSVREIDRTYGHFFNEDLASSQALLTAARKKRHTKKKRAS
jgi:integrase